MISDLKYSPGLFQPRWPYNILFRRPEPSSQFPGFVPSSAPHPVPVRLMAPSSVNGVLRHLEIEPSGCRRSAAQRSAACVDAAENRPTPWSAAEPQCPCALRQGRRYPLELCVHHWRPETSDIPRRGGRQFLSTRSAGEYTNAACMKRGGKRGGGVGVGMEGVGMCT